MKCFIRRRWKLFLCFATFSMILHVSVQRSDYFYSYRGDISIRGWALDWFRNPYNLLRRSSSYSAIGYHQGRMVRIFRVDCTNYEHLSMVGRFQRPLMPSDSGRNVVPASSLEELRQSYFDSEVPAQDLLSDTWVTLKLVPEGFLLDLRQTMSVCMLHTLWSRRYCYCWPDVQG